MTDTVKTAATSSASAGSSNRSARSADAQRRRVGVNCSSSCPSKDHASWGDCVRSKGLQISPAVSDSYGSRQKAWDKELDNYDSAVRQGLQPAGTKQHHVDAAMKGAENG